PPPPPSLSLPARLPISDVRNPRVVGVGHELASFGARVDIHDPWADAGVVRHEYGLDLLDGEPAEGAYDAIVLAVGHREFRERGADRKSTRLNSSHVKIS